MPATALKLREEAESAPRQRADDGPLPLRLERVCFQAGGQRLIDEISLTLEAGTRTVVLGPNGAGKSLLLRLCHGLLRPSAGTIRWAWDDAARLRSAQAFVFQRPVLLRRSAAANVAYALAVAGVPRAERGERVQAALEQVGLAHLADRPARVLSGGEQQRLALARAWAQQPKVMFLDEPTANLDPAATRAIEAVIAALYERGVKIVMTTHDLGQARRHADEIVFLHKGRLVEHTDAARFFTRPDTPEARTFVAGELLA
ncbi:MAG TPA: ATP-binding cassette domain-containing protein [Geminicoccaceae bacterium]|nr:ATP-binding cassette domain-containing protein [Geminicoccaceae bacterium]